MIGQDNRKKIFVFVLMIALCAAPMFAGTTTAVKGVGGAEAKLDLTFIVNAVNLLVGVVAGGYVLLKAALDMFHAVRNADQDPNGIKKVIASLALNVIFLGGFIFLVNTIFKGYMGDSATNATNTGNASFFSGLAGALVNLPL